MMYNVKLTQEAKRQLDEAMEWYALRDVDFAVQWYLGFMQAIRSLAENPESHGLARESGEFEFPIYALVYGSGRRKTHRAIYRIVGGDVEVLTIRHLAQDDITLNDFEL